MSALAEEKLARKPLAGPRAEASWSRPAAWSRGGGGGVGAGAPVGGGGGRGAGAAVGAPGGGPSRLKPARQTVESPASLTLILPTTLSAPARAESGRRHSSSAAALAGSSRDF